LGALFGKKEKNFQNLSREEKDKGPEPEFLSEARGGKAGFFEGGGGSKTDWKKGKPFQRASGWEGTGPPRRMRRVGVLLRKSGGGEYLIWGIPEEGRRTTTSGVYREERKPQKEGAFY